MKKTKVIAFCLAALLMFYAIPMNIYAEFERENKTEAEKTTEGDTYSYLYEDGYSELLSLRDGHTKHFRVPEGGYLALQYANAVHTRGENGAWESIDNSLSEDWLGTYKNESARIRFAKKIGSLSGLLVLKDQSTKLALRLENGNKKSAATVQNGDGNAVDELQKATALEKFSSVVHYEDALDGVDLIYTTVGFDIRQSIVIKAPMDRKYSVSFELKLNGMTAQQMENGSVGIYDEDAKLLYTIVRPYAVDQNGVSSERDAVTLSLSGKNKKYTLTVSVDAAYMSAPERAYPVTLSPDILASTSASTVRTAYAKNGEHYEKTGSTLMDVKSVLHFETEPSVLLPEGATVGKALLTLNESDVGEGVDKIMLYRLSGEIDGENTLENAEALGYASREGGYQWDITSLVEDWQENPESNYGVALMAMDGESTAADVQGSARAIVPVEPLPDLTVTYVTRDGLESYYPTSSYDAGYAGVATVNHATGNLTLTLPTVATSNHILSYAATLFYQGYMAGVSFAGNSWVTPVLSSALARGFKLSVHESVLEGDENGDGVIDHYVYTDADGSTHKFTKSTVEGETDIYYDTDGLLLRMKISSTITITDEAKTVRTFTDLTGAGGWFLASITDSNSNKLLFSYNSSYQPTLIRFVPNGGSEISELQFSYYNGTLIAVYSPRTGDAAVFRYSSTYNGSVSASANAYLREVEFICSGANASALSSYYQDRSSIGSLVVKDRAFYTYDSSSRLTSAEAEASDRRLVFSYDTSARVIEISEFSGNSVGQSVLFDYNIGYTDVRTSGGDDEIVTLDDVVTRYIFDSKKRAVSAYSFNAYTYEIYGATTGVYETQSNIKNNLKSQTQTGGSSVNYLLNGGFDFAGNGTLFDGWYFYGGVYANYTQSVEEGGSMSVAFRPEVGKQACISQEVCLQPGTYTLSFQIDSRQAELESLRIYVYPSDQNLDPFIDEKIPLKASIAYESGSYYSKEFTLDVCKTLTVSFIATATTQKPSIGAKIDNVMLEKSIGASEYSFVQLGGFEDTFGDRENIPSSGVQGYWQNQNGANVTLVTGQQFDKALSIQGNNGSAYATQRVYEVPAQTLNYFDSDYSSFQTNVDSAFILAGYAKGVSVSLASSATFCLIAKLSYYQGAGQADVVRTVSVPIVRTCDGWQYASGFIDAKYDKPAGDTNNYECLRYIDVICDFSNQPSYATAFFDNISLIGTGNSSHVENDYSEDGLLVQQKTRKYITFYTYDNQRRLQTQRNSSGDAVRYVYDDETSLRIYRTIKYERQTTNFSHYYPVQLMEYGYTSTGLLSREEIWAVTNLGVVAQVIDGFYYYDHQLLSNNKIDSSYVYSTNTNYYGATITERNSTGKTTFFSYTSDGRLVAAASPTTGYGTVYTYDIKENLVGVYPATCNSSGAYSKITGAEEVAYTYDNWNRLETITTESTVYSFDYDIFGNTTDFCIGWAGVVSYEYAPYNGKVTKINYANGYSLEYIYDAIENLAEIWYTVNGVRALAYSYEYTAKGQLARVRDHINGNETTYRYSLSGQCVAEHTNPIGADDFKGSNDYEYDDEGRIKVIKNALSYEYNGALTVASISSQYFYDHVGRMTGLSYYIGAVDVDLDYTYDAYDRPATSRLTAIDGSNAMLLDTAYNYRVVDNYYTSGLVSVMTSTVTNTNGVETETTYTYTYDANNNITKVVYSTGQQIRYVYDDLSQLVREDNGILNKTYTYTYDNAGNITSKKTYALTAAGVTPQNPTATDSYTYGDADWGDLLTAYKGQTITYDAIGNPTSYYNGYRYTFSWQGRCLTNVSLYGMGMTFEYREDGLRTKKTVGGVVTEYFYDGSLLIAEQMGDVIVMYYYDENGSPIAMQYRDATMGNDVWDKYIFEKNLQGDVVAIYTTSGTKLVSYTYDAWGNATVSYHNGGGSTSASYNHLRYRGYYYDKDLELYYLQSRYYDAKVGRFINADDTEFLGANGDLNSYNLYAYCSNNPVMYQDPSGHLVISIGALLAGMVFGAVAGAVMSFVTTAWQDFRDDGELFNNSITSDEYWGNIAGGAIAGLGTGACVTLGAGVGVAMTAGGAFSLGSVVLSGATAWSLGAGISFVSGGAAYAARTSIIQKETFQTGDMFVEAFANSAKGTMSFFGGMMGGITGVKHPASSRGVKEFLKYHIGACWFGVYPTNALIGKIKRGVQEVY